MNFQEKNLNSVHGQWSFEELTDKNGILEIVFCADQDKHFKLAYGGYLFYRKMDEGDAILTVSEMSKNLTLGKAIYFFEDSILLDWFKTESGGIYNSRRLIHSRILMVSDVLDIVCLAKAEAAIDSIVNIVEFVSNKIPD